MNNSEDYFDREWASHGPQSDIGSPDWAAKVAAAYDKQQKLREENKRKEKLEQQQSERTNRIIVSVLAPALYAAAFGAFGIYENPAVLDKVASFISYSAAGQENINTKNVTICTVPWLTELLTSPACSTFSKTQALYTKKLPFSGVDSTYWYQYSARRTIPTAPKQLFKITP